MSMDGFVVINKPEGVTSHDVVAKVRRALGQKKVGHTGTLDPFATGVLPVALGAGTKAIQFLDEAIKEYRAVIRLGLCTDTQDHTGIVLLQRDASGVKPQDLPVLADRFLGRQLQLPPMYSALKRNGVPLYALARKGVEVKRDPREVEIFNFDFNWIRLPDACFTVRCSRGTYVRTLAHDFGEALGCGGHLMALHRCASGLFTERGAVTLEALSTGAVEAGLVTVEAALAHMRELRLSECGARKVGNGVIPSSDDFVGDPCAPGERVRLCSEGRLAAVAEFDPVRGMRLARVFH